MTVWYWARFCAAAAAAAWASAGVTPLPRRDGSESGDAGQGGGE